MKVRPLTASALLGLSVVVGGCQSLLADNERFIRETGTSGEDGSGSEGDGGSETAGSSDASDSHHSSDSDEDGQSGGSGDGGSGSGGNEACEPGWLDCSDDPGCETEIGSVEHCGACDHTCMIGAQTYTCDEGVCRADMVLEVSGDVTIDASSSTQNFEGAGVLHVSDMPKRDALIDFGLPPSFPPDTQVDAATLTLYSELDGSPGFGVHRITGDWDPSSVTWDSRPSAVMQPGGVGGTGQGELELEVGELVQAWVDGAPVRGISLRTGQSGEVRLRASETSFAPSLALSLSW